jgi:endonuclease/exonuclease/phosphatase (EEP) superfamily protein YafD
MASYPMIMAGDFNPSSCRKQFAWQLETKFGLKYDQIVYTINKLDYIFFRGLRVNLKDLTDFFKINRKYDHAAVVASIELV